MPATLLENASAAQRLALGRGLAQWSDHIQHSASTLAEQYSALLGRHLGNAQLSGLNNIVQSAPDFDEIAKFARNQGDKATRAGHDEIADYWRAVREAIERLTGDAWTLAEEAGLPVPAKESRPKELKAAINDIYLAVAREWVQHFVAHSLMLARETEVAH